MQPDGGSPHRAREQDPSYFQLSFAQSPIGQAHVAPDGAWLLVNRALSDLLGPPDGPHRIDDIESGSGLYDVIDSAHRDVVRRRLHDIVATGVGASFDSRMVRSDGAMLDVRLSIGVVRDHHAAPVCLLAQVVDRTAEVRANMDLQAARARFESLVASSNDAVIVLDEDGIMRYVSASMERLVGYPSDFFTDRPIGGLMHPDDLDLVWKRFRRLLETGETTTVSYRVTHLNGTQRWLEATCSDRRDDPAIGGIVANVHDITARIDAVEAFRHQAMHDDLTGLPNRTLLTDRILTAISRALRSGRTFALLFCDLDRFKHVNDTLGHDVGDTMLIEMARRMRRHLRRSDTLARLGGDEFVVVVEDLDPASADEVAGRVAADLLASVAEPIVVGDQPLTMSVSIGIAVHHAGQSVKDMLRDADVAMYTAKDRGRNRSVVYDGAMRALTQHRFAMDALVRRALAGEGIVVEYQPIVALDTQRIVGAEALTRIELDGIRHMPGDFIDAAEEVGTIVPLGRKVLQRALLEAATWRPTTSISVNLSARQLADPMLPDIVIDALRAADVPASRLLLEVTETSLVENNELAIATMERLAAIGVRLALDDFGTGWSSLAYLRRFPVSVVKIDRIFVEGATRADSGDLEVIRAVIGLSDALGIQVIAEGIETDLQAAVLAELGCEYGQGFLYGRPGASTPLLRNGDLRTVPTIGEGVTRAG